MLKLDITFFVFLLVFQGFIQQLQNIIIFILKNDYDIFICYNKFTLLLLLLLLLLLIWLRC